VAELKYIIAFGCSPLGNRKLTRLIQWVVSVWTQRQRNIRTFLLQVWYGVPQRVFRWSLWLSTGAIRVTELPWRSETVLQ